GTDGALYGTTSGGFFNDGTVFKVNKDGTGFTTLKNLVPADGTKPLAGLLLGSDGVLYGTTSVNGPSSGTVFRMNQDGGGFAVVHAFNATDGNSPNAAVIEGSDGALYGGTYSGGAIGGGTLFKVNKDGGGFVDLHDFGGPGDGLNPVIRLTEGSDGRIYG